MLVFKTLDEAQRYLRETHGNGELWESTSNYAYFIRVNEPTGVQLPPTYKLGRKYVYVYRISSDWRPSPGNGWEKPKDPSKSRRGKRGKR